VVHSFQRDKSLRPNGLPIDFFIEFYDMIKSNLQRVVKESRRMEEFYEHSMQVSW
jgi:hypothetical protein